MLRLKSERLKMNLSQQNLAAKAGLGYADISRIESGRLIPYPGHLKKLSKFFKIPGAELMKEENQTENHV